MRTFANKQRRLVVNRNGTGAKRSNDVTDTMQAMLPVDESMPPLSDNEVVAEPRARSWWRGRHARLGLALLSIAGIVLIWWGIAVLGNYPGYILPTPYTVAERIWSMLLDGSLVRHVWATLSEMLLGFMVALVLGVVLGYIIGHSRLLERVLTPYIAVSQGLPVLALAPLLAIWIRDDMTRKVVVAALIAFFPILVSTIVAVRSIDRSMLEVARISGANLAQTIYYVELPLGLRPLLAGVKLGLTLSITGAVVAEFISADQGLGFLLTFGRGIFDTTLIFVGLVMLATLAILAYAFISFLERTLITWE